MTDTRKRKNGPFDSLDDMEALAERLFAGPHLLLALVDPELRYVRVSRCFSDMLGRDAADFPGKSVVANGFAARHKGVMREVLDKGQSRVLENWTVAAADQDAKEHGYWRWTIAPLNDPEGRVCCLLLSGCDITERRLLESDVIDAASHERRQVGLEIRDNIGQILAAISMKARILELKLQEQKVDGAEDARELQDLAAEAIISHRRIAHMLYPADLEGGGLLAGLRRLAGDTTQMYGVSCQVTAPDHEPDLEPVQAVHIHAIVKNIIKHCVTQAGAKGLAIEFFMEGGHYMLELTHDGKAYKRTGSITGYRIMTFHAHTIGGTISVQGGTGKFVTFVGRFPRTIDHDS
jgi:signal transduction histidine kinase